MSITNIFDEKCWICGENKKLTKHHTLPKHLNPVNNVVVPICEQCHDRLNEEDYQSLYPFLTKISLSLRDIERALTETTQQFKVMENKLKTLGYMNGK